MDDNLEVLDVSYYDCNNFYRSNIKMKIEGFIKLLGKCHKSGTQTGYSDRIGDLKVTVNPERTIFTINKTPVEKVCKHCGADLTTNEHLSLKVEFNATQEPLSVFQAYLLWMMFKTKQIPYDYASYHKCIAGKRFIENIKEVKGGLI